MSVEQRLRRGLEDLAGQAPVPDVWPAVVRGIHARRRRRMWLAPVAAAAAAAALAVVVLAGHDLHRAGPLPPTQPTPTSSPAPSPSSPAPSAPPRALSTHVLAGSPGQYGFADGKGALARFDSLGWLAVGPTGTVYVSDTMSSQHRSRIRAITPAGQVTTVADEPASQDQGFGALAVDASGTVYAADGQVIRTIGRNGQLSTFAAGFAGPFPSIGGMAFSPIGDLYVLGGSGVEKVTPDGKVSTLNPSCPPGIDCLASPRHIAMSPSGTIYIGSDDDHVRTISPDGQVRELAGPGLPVFSRMSIAFDPVRSFLWVLDTAGLHAVFPDGTVSTVRLAGSLPAPSARLGVGPDGTLYATGEAAIVSLRPAG